MRLLGKLSNWRCSGGRLVFVPAVFMLALWGCNRGEFYVEGDTTSDRQADGADNGDFGDADDTPGDTVIEQDLTVDVPDGDDSLPDIPADPDLDIPDINLCDGTTLADRVMVTAVDVSPDSVSRGYYRPSAILSPLDDGSSKVAWNDGSANAHITPLTAADGRLGPDIVVNGSEVAGFVAHTDGGALLVVRNDVMALKKVDGSGGVVFDVEFVGNQSHDVIGHKWIDNWSDSGRLAWSGSRYGVYFGHTQLWDNGRHQGDMLRFVDAGGSVVGGGWGWGCSHSLEVLMAFNATRDGPVCLSDCYPTKGIHFSHRSAQISSEPSGNCGGGSAAQLGGLVPAADGFYLTFTSPEGRARSDVVLVHVSTSSGVSVGSPIYLTDTNGVEEGSAKLARYGDNLLVAWTGGGGTLFGVVTPDGTFIEGPVDIGQTYDGNNDFINFSNGDVGWVRGAGSQLEIVRLGLCP